MTVQTKAPGAKLGAASPEFTVLLVVSAVLSSKLPPVGASHVHSCVMVHQAAVGAGKVMVVPFDRDPLATTKFVVLAVTATLA